jgi:DNA invertase Pin-like site-specific DNA recombinase
VAKKTKSADSPLVISYARFSSRQQEKGDSLRRQTDLARAYCKRRGWTLSEQTYRDLGVSAFRGKNALIGNLGEFLKAVASGSVPAGSVLLVESLDRITRQGIDEGYEIVKRVLRAGVRLVTLAPEREFDAAATKSLSKGALEIQLILERAAEESERKSERIRAAWQGRRKKARDGEDVLVAGLLPAWIENRNGKLRAIPERAKVVKRIFALAASGYGRTRIAEALKAEGMPSFSGRPDWPSCAIGFILTDRRAVGEYRPRKTDPTVQDRRRLVPDGEPIPNYYPPVVSEREWLAARAGMNQRRRKLDGGRQKPWTAADDALVRRCSVGVAARRTGRSRSAVYQRRHALGLTEKQNRTECGNFVNVFAGLIRNARPPQDSYIVVSRMNATGPAKALLNRAHAEGGKSASPCYLFPLDPFERAILGALREVNPRDILAPNDDAVADDATPLKDALAAVEGELAEASAFLDKNGFSPTIGKRVTTLEARKTELAKALLDAQARAATPASAVWKQYRSLADALDEAPDPRDARLRLRAALHRIVDKIWLLVVPRGRDRFASVQIYFVGGARRDYWIWVRPAQNNGRGKRAPGWFRVRSWTTEEMDRACFGMPPDLGGEGEDDSGNPNLEPQLSEGWFLESPLEVLEKMFVDCPPQPY